MKKCVVVYNPNSGRGMTDVTLLKIKKILQENNYETTILKSEYHGHTKKIIEELKFVNLVISIGGDGTFNEAMTGNLNRVNPLLLSHLPVGTANDIGAMYGYTKNILKNLKLLLKGEIKEVDLCMINDRIFTYSAGIGKFTNVSHQTPRRLKKKLGYLAYIIEGLKELIESKVPLYSLKLQIDNKIYEGKYSLILVSNSNRIGGISNFYKKVKLDDGKFEVLLCDITDKKKIIKSLISLSTKDVTEIPGFKIYKTNHLKIWFDNLESKSWTVDGEEYTDTRKDFEVKISKKVKLLLPKKNIKKLFINN